MMKCQVLEMRMSKARISQQADGCETRAPQANRPATRAIPADAPRPRTVPLVARAAGSKKGGTGNGERGSLALPRRGRETVASPATRANGLDATALMQASCVRIHAVRLRHSAPDWESASGGLEKILEGVRNLMSRVEVEM